MNATVGKTYKDYHTMSMVKKYILYKLSIRLYLVTFVLSSSFFPANPVHCLSCSYYGILPAYVKHQTLHLLVSFQCILAVKRETVTSYKHCVSLD